MKSRVLIIRMNLLPWYNELDDYIDIHHSEFPGLVREQIVAIGEYTIDFISRFGTKLRQISRILSKFTSTADGVRLGGFLLKCLSVSSIFFVPLKKPYSKCEIDPACQVSANDITRVMNPKVNPTYPNKDDHNDTEYNDDTSTDSRREMPPK